MYNHRVYSLHSERERALSVGFCTVGITIAQYRVHAAGTADPALSPLKWKVDLSELNENRENRRLAQRGTFGFSCYDCLFATVNPFR